MFVVVNKLMSVYTELKRELFANKPGEQFFSEIFFVFLLC